MLLPPDDNTFSHMPFLHAAGGETSLLMCLSDKVVPKTDKRPTYRAWKIHTCNPNTMAISRIETGFEDDDVECSPVCYYADEKFCLSFVVGKWEPGIDGDEYRDLRLYKMTGRSLAALDKAELVLPFRVRAGFEWYGKAVFSIGDGRVMHDNLDGIGRYETDVGMIHITRLAPRADHTTSVLVTGFVEGEEEAKTIVYDLDSRKVTGEVKTPGGGQTYKPSLFEGMMAHVVDAGDGVEQHKVEFLKDVG